MDILTLLNLVEEIIIDGEIISTNENKEGE